jgi:hypothetical protein
MDTICYDHLGNKYGSKKEMCDYYEISDSLFYDRFKKGYSLEKILTEPKVNVIKDHLGNEYPSMTVMCKKYGMTKENFKARQRYGWSLEKILTTPIRKNNKKWVDHKGNIYETEKEMCSYYRKSVGLVRSRLKSDWPLEMALTVPRNTYLGEYKIKKRLEEKNVTYFYDCTIATVLDILGLNIEFEEFINEFQKVIQNETNLSWDIEKIKRMRPDFILYTNNDNQIIGVIEHDGRQHHNFVEFFHKTIKVFLERNEADYVKNNLWEYLNIPMLRTREDQIELIDEMVDDFLEHPQNYIVKHNTYFTEEEYWAPLTENYGSLDIAFSF